MTPPTDPPTHRQPAEVHRAVLACLMGSDQRYTPGRRDLVTALIASPRPVTIDEIRAGCPGVTQSSAYRNLGVLEACGVVQRIVTSDSHARYELSETLTGHHHHHLICTSCGRVTDVSLPDPLEARLHDDLAELAGRHGFALHEHRLDLVGRCGDCGPDLNQSD